MDCPKNNYENLAGIVESFANDQQFWSGKNWLETDRNRDSQKDTVKGGHEQKESIMAPDSPIADASAHNRSFFCMEATISHKEPKKCKKCPRRSSCST